MKCGEIPDKSVWEALEHTGGTVRECTSRTTHGDRAGPGEPVAFAEH